MSKDEILPEHFKGDWTVVASLTDVGEKVTVSESGGKYYIELQGKRLRLTYDAMTDSIYAHRKDLCISFWRHPSMDHIFANSIGKNTPLWGAQRRRQKPDEDKKKANQKICRHICGKWKITKTTGSGTPKKKSTVIIARADIRKYKYLKKATPRMFYLFEDSGKTKECYDLLVFDSRTVTFNSVFRVRSINFWPRQYGRKTIFAMFDNRFTLPVGHFGDIDHEGGRNLATLMSFESEQVAAGLNPHEEPVLGTPGDPNTGCWTGDGG